RLAYDIPAVRRVPPSGTLLRGRQGGSPMQLRSWESIERRIARAAAAFALAAGALAAPALAQCDPAVLSHAGGRPLTLVARDDIAYVAYHGDLRIIDVSNPTAPALLGTALVPGAAQRIDLGQTHLGMACGDGGLVIVDVSNPAAPVVRSVVQMDYAADVAVSNHEAFVVDSTDLKIRDISAPP